MNKPRVIIVFGANGSGKTTLGREIARILAFKHMDHEAYAFAESEIPYTKERSRDEQIKLMLADIEKGRGCASVALLAINVFAQNSVLEMLPHSSSSNPSNPIFFIASVSPVTPSLL